MNIKRYRNTLITAAVAAALGVGATACSKSPDYSSQDARSGSATEAMSDTAITTQVKAKLATESSIRSSDIRVNTANGVVTLEGSVADAAAKSSVERIVKTVTGVTSVHNRLNTAPGSMTGSTTSGSDASRTTSTDRMAGTDRAVTTDRTTTTDNAQEAMSDTWITTKVKALLLADSDAKGFDVEVETRDGVVTLQGDLDDQAAIAHVRDIAAGVEGVKSVNTTALTANRR